MAERIDWMSNPTDGLPLARLGIATTRRRRLLYQSRDAREHAVFTVPTVEDPVRRHRQTTFCA